MNTSSKSTLLKVVSIILIVGAALSLIVSVIPAIMGAAAALLTQRIGALLTIIFSIGLVVCELLAGVFGLLHTQPGFCKVIGIIMIAFAVGSLFFVKGSIVSDIISIGLSAAYLYGWGFIG